MESNKLHHTLGLKTPSSSAGRATRNCCDGTPGSKRLLEISNRSLAQPRSKRRIADRCDRFIPNRSSTDIDLANYLVVKKESTTGDSTPIKSTKKAKEQRCLFRSERRQSVRQLFSYGPRIRQEAHPCLGCSDAVETPIVKPRRVEVHPSRIMEAPGVSKNFYFNLVDWGVNNIVAVGLKEHLYYWDATYSKAYIMPTESEEHDLVTCVKWRPDARRHILAHKYGTTKLWDSTCAKLISQYQSPTVMACSWKDMNVVTLGAGDGTITTWDTRCPAPLPPNKVTAGIICGATWNRDGTRLAVGCNDNKVQVFEEGCLDEARETMIYQSAVKALAWNPNKSNLLATGSGQNDQRIVIWDLKQGAYKTCIDTQSQITGICWSSERQEVLTSHGHFDPALKLWDLRDDTQIANLEGHSKMIVSISKNPLGENVISLSADNSLRIWNVFQKPAKRSSQLSKVSQFSMDSIR